MTDLYQTITDKIIEAIEAGVQRGGKPLWKGQGCSGGMPFNFSTGNRYSGVNVLVLWLTAAEKGYSVPAWLTYKQAAAMGGQVRKGEKGTHIVYFEPLKREERDEATGETKEKVIPMLRQYVVFNVAQCDGLELPTPEGLAEFAGIEAADAILAASGAKIIEGGTSAAYYPGRDEIRVPDRGRFEKAESFYAVTLHELTHWTGHKSRLARDFSGRFGTEAYAFEELIAELGAAFTCAELGIIPQTMNDHASYIDSWLRVLKQDKRAIFTAASQASKAHGFLMESAAQLQRQAA